MKADTIYLINDEKLDEALAKVRKCELGNKFKVTISDAGNKTSRQHKYQWRLYSDVSKSGIGGKHEETPKGTHIVCKFRFALPVMLAKDENFAWLYEMVKKEIGNDTDKLMWFVDMHVSTMDFTVNEGAQYITDIINFYASRGAILTDPSEYNL